MIALTTYDRTTRWFNPHQIVSIETWGGAQQEFQGMTSVYANSDDVLVRESVDEVRALIESFDA